MPAKRATMWKVLIGLRGNTRACVYTEPLWGIPFNLYLPYVSIYMLALGLRDDQIGLLASIGIFVCSIIISGIRSPFVTSPLK